MPINEAFIRSIANAKSFARGQDYYDSETVTDLEKRGDILTALVEGSQDEPYQVTINFKGTEFVSADCDCPYDMGGQCKHVVAVLLAYLHESGEIVEKPSIETVLADVSREKLLSLLTDILKEQPQLISWVEGQLVRPTPVVVAAAQPHQPRPPINPALFVKQVAAIFPSTRSARYSDYDEDDSMVDEIIEAMEAILQQIDVFFEPGHEHNLLTILEAVAQEYVKRWGRYDDYEGDLDMAFEPLTATLAEAILQTDLTLAERKNWQAKIKKWQSDASKYGADGAWELALVAAEQGWDYPPLLKVLEEGLITPLGAWENEEDQSNYANELAEIRLRILDNQGRTQEYLWLAEAESQIALYLIMLVRLGRAQEAIDYPYINTAKNALVLAQTLQEYNMPKEALLVAERGLSLPEPYPLAKWLTDVAAQEGSLALALLSAKLVFKKTFTLADYQRVKSLAGEQWAELKPELLKALAESTSYEKVKIYIAERMVDEAIQLVEKSPYLSADVWPQLIEIATSTQPDWVIKTCRKQAEAIMDAGKSNQYNMVAEWLKWAKKAYLQTHRQAEWSAYLEGLITKHNKKYTLRPLLEKLR